MTALSTPYTLLRRDGEARASRPDLPQSPRDSGGGVPSDAGTATMERRNGLLRPEVARLIAERGFAVAFQPVVRLSDRRPVSHEALLRLRPQQGAASLSTRQLVEAARAWDLGTALDAAALDVALATWPRTATTPVSVNVFARSLRDPVFFARLLSRVAGDRATLAVEVIGIDDGPDDLAGLIALVPALRGVGIRVVLDDFAANEACLGGIRAARFDEVKLSTAMVGAAVAGPRGRRLLQALVALATTSGARVVAKMIETVPQVTLLEELGVQFGQGWQFGAPALLPASRRNAA